MKSKQQKTESQKATDGSQAPIRTFLADRLAVRVYADHRALARDAASTVRSYLKEGLAARGSARVILATGNSQMQFLDALTGLDGIDWSRVILFHMDEYLGISANQKASFRCYMKKRVEKRIKPRLFHYLEGDALQPIEECERYANLLTEAPIDLCCLGIGENGHLAFNDPPVADFRDKRMVKIVKLDLACRQQQVDEGHYSDIASVPQYALTLTIPALCSAKKMVCTVPEKRKAPAVKSVLQGPITTACPASILRKQSHAVLLLDADSASRL